LTDSVSTISLFSK